MGKSGFLNLISLEVIGAKRGDATKPDLPIHLSLTLSIPIICSPEASGLSRPNPLMNGPPPVAREHQDNDGGAQRINNNQAICVALRRCR